LVCVVVSNRDHAKRPRSQRDRVARSRRRHDCAKRRRVGGCPVLLLESEGEACPSVLPLSRLGPNGRRAYRRLGRPSAGLYAARVSSAFMVMPTKPGILSSRLSSACRSKTSRSATTGSSEVTADSLRRWCLARPSCGRGVPVRPGDLRLRGGREDVRSDRAAEARARPRSLARAVAEDAGQGSPPTLAG
jgi:hypothetical protein